jgi:hypothetical protein
MDMMCPLSEMGADILWWDETLSSLYKGAGAARSAHSKRSAVGQILVFEKGMQSRNFIFSEVVRYCYGMSRLKRDTP